MARSPTVVVVGSVNRDYVCRVPSVPFGGQTLLGGELTLGSGGKGGNQAAASALLGAPTSLVACIGDDPDGQALVRDLAAAGVDTSGVRHGCQCPNRHRFRDGGRRRRELHRGRSGCQREPRRRCSAQRPWRLVDS